MSGVATIPAGAGFLDALARGLLDGVAGGAPAADPLALGETVLLLPGRRAVHGLRRAFLRATGGAATLLPRMMPVGAIDPDIAGFAAPELPAVAAALELPPPIPAAERHILLTRLVAAADAAIGIDQAARHAAFLARLLDEVAAEELDFDGLARIVPAEHAAHWQDTLRFLEIVTRAWPAILAERGMTDPGRHAAAMLDALAAAWTANPPSTPVIAGGFVGTTPALRRLLATVAGLPAGRVVLPGLDREMEDRDWQAIDATHPQRPLKLILDSIGIDRSAVEDWPVAESGPCGRDALLREVMRPAATSEAWRAATLPAEAVAGLLRIDCATAREEAEVVALALREVLEIPGRTAALVTADRTLGRRVATQLARWRIEVDDSAGRPLRETEIGAFLELLLDCAASGAAPLALLALLKHPLTALGNAPAATRAAARALERAALRGIAPAPGLDGLAAALPPDPPAAITALLAALRTALAPLAEALAMPAIEPAELLSRQIAAAEAFARTDGETGAERLWRGEAGETAQAFLAEIMPALREMPSMAGRHWPGFFAALAEPIAVRPLWGTHPRLAILGPLEARLERFDRTILGGLNEGTWPAVPPADPWMSRPMRQAFGLPPRDEAIGRSAHDFSLAAAGADVMLIRADMVEGTPTVPSRWLMRLDAVLAGTGLALDRTAARHWRALAAMLDTAPAVRPVEPPRPAPPLAARPRRFSVSDVATLMVDPYALYAKRILRLTPLEEIELDPTAADRGTVIHAALFEFLLDCGDGPLPHDALDRLLAAGRRAFRETLPDRIEIETFWWPRFERIAAWFVEAEAKRRTTHRPVGLEVKGSLTLDLPGGPVVLTARADRVDRDGDGRLVIVDYKTGTTPSPKQVESGFAPQLPLEAAIARAGGFTGVPATPVAALEYWRLSGAATPGQIRVIGDDADALALGALDGLIAVLAPFDDPTTPYLSQPRRTPPRFSDYAHLARVKEWASEEDTE